MSPKQRKTGKLRSLKRPSVSPAKAGRVKGGVEPINGGPAKVSPINDLRKR